jgi:hypothetical protein
LADGDTVTAGFYGYDVTPGASPSLRIWAHYSNATSCLECPGEYQGSAGGNADYTAGTGWDYVWYTWVFDSGGDDAVTGMVIEARLYSTPATAEDRTDYWIDNLVVRAPSYSHILFPDFSGPSATEPTSWGRIKSIFR